MKALSAILVSVVAVGAFALGWHIYLSEFWVICWRGLAKVTLLTVAGFIVAFLAMDVPRADPGQAIKAVRIRVVGTTAGFTCAGILFLAVARAVDSSFISMWLQFTAAFTLSSYSVSYVAAQQLGDTAYQKALGTHWKTIAGICVTLYALALVVDVWF